MGICYNLFPGARDDGAFRTILTLHDWTMDECSATTTKIKNIPVNMYEAKYAHKKFYGKYQTMQNT